MFVVPENPNVVEVPMIQTGCCKSEFDSTYPIRLNGIIGQNEFQQSIANINQAGSSSRIYLLILLVVFISVSVLGFVVTIVGVSVAVESDSVPFPVFLGVGMGLMVVGMLACSIGSCIIQSRVSAHVQKVVTEESAKYSTRIPPCSWRLNPLTFSSGYGRNQRTAVIYRLYIEIGSSTGTGDGFSSYQPSAAFHHHQSGGGFCSHCGTVRPNSTARFCSVCGQAFGT